MTMIKYLALASAHVSKKFILLLFAGFLILPIHPSLSADEGQAVVSVSDELSEVIAILDMQQLLNESKAAESIRKQIESKRNQFQKQIEKDEEKLKNAEKELIKQREILSKESFLEKNKDFQTDVLKAQKEIGEKKYKLDKAYANAMAKLREEIVKLTAKIAAKEKYAVVLSRQNVVIVDKNMDITAKVMGELNKSVKKISVE